MEWVTDPITGQKDADLTYEEAAKLLNIPARTLRELAWRPDFPVIIYNAHCHRIRWTRLKAWIDEHLVGRRYGTAAQEASNQ